MCHEKVIKISNKMEWHHTEDKNQRLRPENAELLGRFG